MNTQGDTFERRSHYGGSVWYQMKSPSPSGRLECYMSLRELPDNTARQPCENSISRPDGCSECTTARRVHSVPRWYLTRLRILLTPLRDHHQERLVWASCIMATPDRPEPEMNERHQMRIASRLKASPRSYSSWVVRVQKWSRYPSPSPSSSSSAYRSSQSQVNNASSFGQEHILTPSPRIPASHHRAYPRSRTPHRPAASYPQAQLSLNQPAHPSCTGAIRSVV